MKTKILLLLLLLLLYLLLISLDFFQEQKGPHDGVLREVENYVVEFKDAAPLVYIFLLDKDKRSIDNKALTAQVFVIFVDGTTMQKSCFPYGRDGFSVDIGLLNYAACKVMISVFGRSIEAAFDSERPWVKNFK